MIITISGFDKSQVINSALVIAKAIHCKNVKKAYSRFNILCLKRRYFVNLVTDEKLHVIKSVCKYCGGSGELAGGLVGCHHCGNSNDR